MKVAILGLTLLLGCALAAPGADSATEYPQEYYHAFKEASAGSPDFVRIGPEALECVKFEPEGLRITLPRGRLKMSPNTGVILPFAVTGDFEITTSFTILQAPQAKQSPLQTRFTLFVPLATPGETKHGKMSRATLSWRVAERGGTEFFPFVFHKNANVKRSKWNGSSTKANSGRLRLARQGRDVFFYASEGVDGSFTLLRKHPFSDQDVQDVLLVASTGGPDASFDVRVLDVRIRADSVSTSPAVAQPSGSSPGWLTPVLLSCLAGSVALGFWGLFRRRGRGQSPPPAPHPS